MSTRSVVTMINQDSKDNPKAVVFDDPVAYLLELGITSELVSETALPAAA